MKILLPTILAVFSCGSLFPVLADDQRAEGSAPEVAPKCANDLERIRAEYERRRAEALRPVATWYRAQLESLDRKLQQDVVSVAKTREAIRETFWQDDQPELKQALRSQDWIWRSELDADGVALKFAEEGSVHHSGLNGRWKITGPNEVTIWPDDDSRYVLRFGSSLTDFVADRRGVTGERRTPEK